MIQYLNVTVESVFSEASNVMDGMTVVMAVMREQFVVSLTLKMVEFIFWVASVMGIVVFVVAVAICIIGWTLYLAIKTHYELRQQARIHGHRSRHRMHPISTASELSNVEAPPTHPATQNATRDLSLSQGYDTSGGGGCDDVSYGSGSCGGGSYGGGSFGVEVLGVEGVTKLICTFLKCSVMMLTI